MYEKEMMNGNSLLIRFVNDLPYSDLYGPRREKKTDFVAREQQRRRPACASVQSDQRLCYSLPEKNNS